MGLIFIPVHKVGNIVTQQIDIEFIYRIGKVAAIYVRLKELQI